MKIEVSYEEAKFMLKFCDSVIDEYETDGCCWDYKSAYTLKDKLLKVEELTAS